MLWEQRARRYQGFEHLEPELVRAERPTEPAPAGLALSPLVSCGFELFSFGADFIMLSGTRTVPNLNRRPTQIVTAQIVTTHGAPSALPVHPGDTISAILCLLAGPDGTTAGTAAYFFANETTFQTVNFTAATGFPPAARINAGVGRSGPFNRPPDPLGRFGVVYFDELIAG